MSSIACFGGIDWDAKAHLLADPVPGTSNPATVVATPGGVAANIARLAARLGCRVSLFGVVGDDPAGARLLAAVEADGVDISGVRVLPASRTAGYTAILDGSGALHIGIADMAIFDAMDAAWAAEAAAAAAEAEFWVVDTNPTVEALAAIAAHSEERSLVADPVSVAKAPRLEGVLHRLRAVTPDASELEAMTGKGDLGDAAILLLERDVGTVLATCGADGVLMADAAGVETRRAIPPRAFVDVTGAGDCFAGGYVYALAQGLNDPVGWGLAAASLAVESDASVPDVDEQDVAARLAGAKS